MPTETICVGVERADGTERVFVDAVSVERDRSGTVRLYDGPADSEDSLEIATFWNALFVVRDADLAE